MTDAFEWDEAKRRQNLAKHGVDFRHAVRVFEGAVLEVTDERRNYGEVRIGCLGEIDGRIYRLVYTQRGRTRRIISAWKPMSETKERITRVTLEEAKRLKDETDYARLDAMTDDEIARAVAEDPDATPLDVDWAKARVVLPPGKENPHPHKRSSSRVHGSTSTENRLTEAGMPRINHIALKVADLEAATRFYENVYGFRQVATGRARGHISRHMTDGYLDLALMVYDNEDDPEAKLVAPGPAIHHFGIEVDDHEGFAETVVANGGTILSKPGEIPIKYRSPDGTVAEIVPKGRYDKMRDAAE